MAGFSEILLFVMQVVVCFLLAAGILFVIIGFRTKFDDSFQYFGYSLILLSVLTSIDLWITPRITDARTMLYVQRIFHILACGYMVMTSHYFVALTRVNHVRLLRVSSFAAMVCSVLFLTDLFLVLGTTQKSTPTVLYNIFFFPLVLFNMSYWVYLMVSRLKRGSTTEKKILIFLLFGFGLFFLGGILDMLVMMGILPFFISFSLFGAAAFGLSSLMVFTERFLQLLRDRDQTHEKLQTAYADLQQSSTLKQLGESQTIISHEIRNYMFAIAGNAQLMLEKNLVEGPAKEKVDQIISTAIQCQKFSQEILQLSRTHILEDKKKFDICTLIQEVVKKNFSAQAGHFDLKELQRAYPVAGDWDKLNQVFINLFGNALDAAHPEEPLQVRVRVSGRSRSAVLVTVEDNGVGCNQEQLNQMFTAFYTTKKNRAGTGLGLSISRTIVESHGGHIRADSKNLLGGNSHGLKFHIAFPNFAADQIPDPDDKSPILVIKGDLPNIAGIIRIFQNVYTNPYFVQDADDLMEQKFKRKIATVLCSQETAKANFGKLKEFGKLRLLSQHQGSLFVYEFGTGEAPIHFSEEYVLSRMLMRVPEPGIPEPVVEAVA